MPAKYDRKKYRSLGKHQFENSVVKWVGITPSALTLIYCETTLLYDRVLAVNAFGTRTVLVIGVVGFFAGRPDFLDIALLYALINFFGTIAVLKFFRYRSIGDVMWRPPKEERGFNSPAQFLISLSGIPDLGF